MKFKVKYIQISNIAPQATKDQMSSLFSYIGKIEDIRLYPTVRDVLIPVHSRICFIKFQDRESVLVSQHMTNTVFIDRAITVIPYLGGDIPDEKTSMDILHSNGAVPGLATDAKWPSYVTNHIEGAILRTDDPKLAENGLPDYPNLPATTESYKVNEIRRTVTIDNINPKVTAEDILSLGETVGEVKYVKMGLEKDGSTNCLLEFSELTFVVPAMHLHKKDFMGNQIIVNHATTAIEKPLCKSNEIAQAEIEEAMKRVRDVQTSLFNSNLDPLAFLDATVKDKFSLSRSRSRSRSRRRTRSKSRSSKTRRRTRSRSRRRSGSRHRSEHSSRSRRHRSGRRRSTSRPKRSSKRSRSRSRSKTERSKKEKDSKTETSVPNIDAIAELISKEIEKGLDIAKKETDSAKKEVESVKKEVKSIKKEKEKTVKESKSRRSISRSRSRDRHRHSSRSRRRSRSRGKRRSRSRSRKSRSRSRRRKSKERRSTNTKRRHSRSPSKKRKHRREGSRSRGKSADKKDRKTEKKSPEPKKISRNYDEEDEMYIEEKKPETIENKEEAIDMDISD